MTDRIHHVNVHLTRERPPIRRAVLESTGDEVTFGVPGWQGEHYGFAEGTVETHPGTLDYLVASVAGCLLGTFGGALKARGIDTTGDRLTADAVGEVGVTDKNVLKLRRIVVRYRLEAEEEHRAAAERVLGRYAAYCPNAISVSPAIEIASELDFVPLPAGAPA